MSDGQAFILRDNTIRQNAQRFIQALNLDSKVWQVEIKPYRKNRSKAQNRLYWKWLTLIGSELGYQRDEMHAIMADMFLEPITVQAMGKTICVAPSTTKLNTKEFTQYLEQIEIFASSEFGITLPRPDDLYWEAMGVMR